MTADEVPLAPWGLRLVGMVIDSLVVSVLATVALQLSVANLSERLQTEVLGFWSQVVQGSTQIEPSAEMLHLQTLLTIATVSVTLAYGLLCLLTLSGTLGQRVLGMRVVPVDHGHEKVSPGAAVLRTVAWSLLSSGYGLFQAVQIVNGLMPLWHPRRQTLHDLLSRTQVVRRR